jgi:hypothetical protein
MEIQTTRTYTLFLLRYLCLKKENWECYFIPATGIHQYTTTFGRDRESALAITRNGLARGDGAYACTTTGAGSSSETFSIGFLSFGFFRLKNSAMRLCARWIAWVPSCLLSFTMGRECCSQSSRLRELLFSFSFIGSARR